MRVLGVNTVFHDPASALVVDGEIVAAAEEERFNRRKHGKPNVPFSAWEMPTLSAAWCLEQAGVRARDLDAVAVSFDPSLTRPPEELGLDDPWDPLRVTFATRTPSLLADALPGLDPDKVVFVPHHKAHAASAALAGPHRTCASLVLDGRGEAASHLAGSYRDGALEVLAAQSLPHSLGFLYEDLTAHLGFHRSSDEYKVMALASYGKPRHLADFSELVRTTDDGGFVTEKIDWEAYAPRGTGELTEAHADLAATVQKRLEQVLLELATWIHDRTGHRALTMAGGTALNCVANAVILRDGPYDEVWVQPAAGDAGTALGAALHVAQERDRLGAPMTTAALGRGFSDEQLEQALKTARVPYDRPADLAASVADDLAANRVVAWFQGRAEYGPRALGHRSLLANPGLAANLELLNDIKGREQFRPVAPLCLLERASDIFEGRIPSEYMLFVHEVKPGWRDRIPAVVHVDGTARVQTVDRATEPLLAGLLDAFEARTGVPVLVNTSLNTAGRPIVDSPSDVLELFGSAPVDTLVMGPFVVRRADVFAGGSPAA
ncbi:carbamoyltransferase [Motilibacter peucedani]|uniref:Carbamoyltransferase n=1 Tax=Motilibacter peucedani TaxID=598650 RepID=A0A420XTZ3_9ACTN|nr:carbamoyltransferase C-terminal domain-containing protein [Motilibacter peucedani]RKS80220.1 carbamoyltransferase [Motilibacter peucedani]